MLIGLLSALTAAWAFVGVILAVTLPQTPIWTLFGFELVIAVSSLLGVLLGLGRFREAPALALACVAGTILVGSFLGYRGSAGAVGSLSLKTWVVGRIAIGAVLAALAALTVLVRNRKSWGALCLGAMFGALPAAVALMFGLAVLGYGRPIAPIGGLPTALSGTTTLSTPVAPPAAKQPAWLDMSVRKFTSIGLFQPAKGGKESGRVVLLTVLGILLIGLTSAGMHYLIRAFQLGTLPDPAAPSPLAVTKPAAPARA